MSQNSITLTGGMRKNLYSLQSTNTLLERTQSRMASGLRVQTAVDDPVNYFTALSHRQRAEDLGSRKDEMAESIQTVMAGNEGVTAITSLIASAKSLAQSAMSASSEEEVNTLETQYNEVLNQIDLLVNDSGYKGVNLLASDTHTVNFNEEGDSNLVMVGFDASREGLSINQTGETVTVAAEQASATISGGTAPDNYVIDITADAGGTLDGEAGNAILFKITTGGTEGISSNTADGITTHTIDMGAAAKDADWIATQISTVDGLTASATTGGDKTAVVTTTDVAMSGGEDETNTDINWWNSTNGAIDKDVIRVSISQLDEARTTLRSESQKLSTNLSTITIRQDFTKGMINTLEDGAAELTNADMNQEGANMLMLQTRQSLGTTSLSLASQAAQSVLRLF